MGANVCLIGSRARFYLYDSLKVRSRVTVPDIAPDVVEGRSVGVVQHSLVSVKHHLFRRNRFDVGGHLVSPVNDTIPTTLARVRVSFRPGSAPSLATGLIHQFPSENGGVVVVCDTVDLVLSGDDVLHPVFVCLAEDGVGVELAVVGDIEAAALVDTNEPIDTTKVVPVVGHDVDKFDTVATSRVQNVIETTESSNWRVVVFNFVGSVVPALEPNFLALNVHVLASCIGRFIQNYYGSLPSR